MITEKLIKYIQETLEGLGMPQVEFVVEHPGDESHGDYSTNVALVVWPKIRKISNEKPEWFDPDKPNTLIYQNPRKLAESIKNDLLENQIEFISKIEIAGPGFINFYLSREFLVKQINEVLSQGEKYGTNENLKDKKIVVEYTDPNPFKEFHIGHLYSNSVGESISRILEAHGAEVWRADFFGDVGMHAAKSVWGLLQKLEEDQIDFNDLGAWDLNKRIEYFGQSYAKGATAYKDDELAQEEIKQLNFLIFKVAQEEILPQYDKEKEIDFDQFIKPSRFEYEYVKSVYVKGRQWSLDYFETIYKRVGTKFDGYYPESLTGEYGYNMILDGLEKGIFEKGDKGAIVFPGEKFGLHKRVFINSMGLPTYEAKDFGLLHAKYHDFKYDKSVIVTGNEINEYFQVVLKAMQEYESDLGNVTTHIGHGMVRLPEGKMSSRTGKIIRGEWVLDEAKKRVLEVLNKSDSVDEKERDEVAEKIAVGAVKYAFLKHGVGSDIAFDFDTTLSFEGNSGPYLQYSCVRARSICKDQSILPINSNYDFNDEEKSVLRSIYRFPEVIVETAEKYAPHTMTTYLFELAQRFNGFYNKHSVLSADTDEQKQFRLALTASVAQIIENGLGILGIEVPLKM